MKKYFNNLILFSLVIFGILALSSCDNTMDTANSDNENNNRTNKVADTNNENNLKNNEEIMKNTDRESIASGLTFELSDDVDVQKVKFKNRYGIMVAGDMYTAKDINKSKKYPAIIIGTPYGGVKEQGAGIYAQEMAKRGFVTVAFDESFNGESGGDPRSVSSPDIFVEDFSAAVDFMGTRDFVDREKIGVIGICGSGGFALTAAQVDQRIKAVATASMYDISSMVRDGFGKNLTDDERKAQLEQMSEQRWTDFENGGPIAPTGFTQDGKPAETLPEGLPAIMSEFFEYYGMERGFHPNAKGGFTQTSGLPFMNFSLMSHLKDISPRPILFIMGENAHSRYYTEDAYDEAAEPKELVIVPNARHIDLYDGGINGENYIPFDKLYSFFSENLNK